MTPIAELAQNVAASIVLVDPGDLQALANLHTGFEAVAAAAAQQLDAAFAQRLACSATAAAKSIERIILGEVDSAQTALQQAGEFIAEIHAILDSAASGQPVAPVVAVVVSTAAEVGEPPAAPAADLTEAAFNLDDLPLIREFTSEAQGHLESAEAQILKLEEAPDDGEAINAIFRSFHTIKGVAGFLNLRQIGALAHTSENLLDLARHGKLTMVGDVVDVVLQAIDAMKGLMIALDNAAPKGIAMALEPALPALLDRLKRCATGETSADTAVPATSPAAPLVQSASPAPAVASAPEAAANTHGSSADSTVKVSTERLDNLINMVGELVIAQSMVSQDVAAVAEQDQRLGRNISHLGKITRELQELSMAMRMVPISGLFQKMARLVRDLSRKAHKEIDLQVLGGDTDLDRNVVEVLGDPLVHMIRNAADHGIEPPDVRTAAGKQPMGKIALKACHQGGNVVIEIADDGKGLDKRRLLQKGIERGIVRPDEQLSDVEIFKLVFHPGLSTAEKVTDISGRGVGMDVVRRNIEALRGSIDIASTEGVGSTFTIRLPLTLAVIDGLVVMVGSQRYILPILSIEQSVRPAPGQVSTVQGRGEMCLVRGSLLPLVRLHKTFGIANARQEPTEALIVIVHDNHRRCCLLVDELAGQQQVVIKSLGEGVGQVPGVSGAAILGDGNISLILDVPGLLAVKR